MRTYFKWLMLLPVFFLAGCKTTEYITIPDSYLDACHETAPTNPIEFLKLRDPYKREHVLSQENIKLREDVKECDSRISRIRDYQTFMIENKPK